MIATLHLIPHRRDVSEGVIIPDRRGDYLAELKEDEMVETGEEGMKRALLWKEVGYRYDMWRVADDDGRDSRRESDAVTS